MSRKSGTRLAAAGASGARAATVETLENRRLMSVAVALQPNNVLLSIDTSDPGTILATTRVRGLDRRETLVGIDFRPADGDLFAIGSSSRAYRIDLSSGAATPAGTAFAPALTGTQFDADFNPSVDRLRVVSDSDQNLRINPDDGAAVDADPEDAGVQADENLAYAPTDANVAVDPTIAAAAYANNVAGAATTTLYGIDARLGVLVAHGSVGGAPVSPNTGQLFTVGSLGFTPVSVGGFDVATVGGTDTAYAAFQTDARQRSKLYTINLSTGRATAGGDIGRRRQPTLDLAIAPAGVDFVGVNARNEILSLNTAVPHLVLARARLNGIGRGQRVLGLDYRPADRALYALTSGDQLYRVDVANGSVTPVGAASAVELNGSAYGIDFNPVVDRLRVVNNANQNVRYNPADGAAVDFDPNVAGVQPDTNLMYIAGDVAVGVNPEIVGVAYTSNVAGAATTTLYGIDSNRNTLVTQGTQTGTPTSPNTGQLLTVGPLGANTNDVVGFDIRTAPDGGEVAYATLVTDTEQDGLYTIDLASGRATFVATLNRRARAIRDIAMSLP